MDFFVLTVAHMVASGNKEEVFTTAEINKYLLSVYWVNIYKSLNKLSDLGYVKLFRYVNRRKRLLCVTGKGLTVLKSYSGYYGYSFRNYYKKSKRPSPPSLQSFIKDYCPNCHPR